MSARVQWRYVAPNAVTSAGIAVGMASIGAALLHDARLAAWLVIIAVLLDKLDGTVARLLKASSRFGEQMDSFSDLITFGVAPVAFFLSWSESQTIDPLYRVVTWGCGFLYVIAAALRLSKFNLFSSYFGKDHFFGVPTTLCGALLASGLLTLEKYDATVFLLYFMPVAHAGLALLMVSNVPLPKLHRRGKLWLDVFQFTNVALTYVVGLTALFLPYEWRFPEYLLACALVYLVAGAASAVRKGVHAPPLPPPGRPEGEGGAPQGGGEGGPTRPRLTESGTGGEVAAPAEADTTGAAEEGAPS